MLALRLMVIHVFLFLMITGSVSCSNSNVIYKKKLFAPLSKSDINRLLEECKSRNELIEKCGTPLHVQESNGVEHIEFIISFDKIYGPTKLMLSSFVVVVSNDVVLSWYPRSRARMR